MGPFLAGKLPSDDTKLSRGARLDEAPGGNPSEVPKLPRLPMIQELRRRRDVYMGRPV